MSVDRELIGELEELAMNAWPAEVIQTVDGWRLRFSDGVSRRANSVWSNQPSGTRPLSDRIAQAEEFYRPRPTDACFHVSPLSPPRLDEALAARGYRRNGDTEVQSVALSLLLARADAAQRGAEISLSPSPSAAWQDVAWPEPELRPDVRLGILQRIGSASVCALALESGRPVAAGLGVAERGHVGMFSLRTLESERGRGHARAILRALASWGAARGAQTAYLQVEADNLTALGSYARAGFRTVYRYHYRSLALG